MSKRYWRRTCFVADQIWQIKQEEPAISRAAAVRKAMLICNVSYATANRACNHIKTHRPSDFSDWGR